MSVRSRFRGVVRAALRGWIAGCLIVLPLQLVEAIRNAGLNTVRTHPGVFAELIGLSMLLWMLLSLAVACYCCCCFLLPIVWVISPGRIVAHRARWVGLNAAFGLSLMTLRSHVWTAFNHDGVGFGNFWVWSSYAVIFFGVTAEVYFRNARKLTAAARRQASSVQPG
jgi:hypothetical protein